MWHLANKIEQYVILPCQYAYIGSHWRLMRPRQLRSTRSFLVLAAFLWFTASSIWLLLSYDGLGRRRSSHSRRLLDGKALHFVRPGQAIAGRRQHESTSSHAVSESLRLHAVASFPTEAAQQVATMTLPEHPEVVLLLVANYYHDSSAFIFNTTSNDIVQVARFNTQCAHSWALFEQQGNWYAAVANYCAPDSAIYKLDLPKFLLCSINCRTAAGRADRSSITSSSSTGINSQAQHNLDNILHHQPADIDGSSGTDSCRQHQALLLEPVLTFATAGASHLLYGHLDHRPVLLVSNYNTGTVAVLELQHLSNNADASGSSSGDPSISSPSLALRPLANISHPGAGATALCSVATAAGAAATVLAVAAYWQAGSFNTTSGLYAWQGDAASGTPGFVSLANISTAGAHGATCFHLGTGATQFLYVAFANARDDVAFDVPSLLLSVDADLNVLPVQHFSTVGAHDVKHFVLGSSSWQGGGSGSGDSHDASPAGSTDAVGTAAGRHMMVFANRGRADDCKPDQMSQVFVASAPASSGAGAGMQGTAGLSEKGMFVQAQGTAGLPLGVPSGSCVTSVQPFSAAGGDYLVAVNERLASGDYVANSTIWRWI